MSPQQIHPMKVIMIIKRTTAGKLREKLLRRKKQRKYQIFSVIMLNSSFYWELCLFWDFLLRFLLKLIILHKDLSLNACLIFVALDYMHTNDRWKIVYTTFCLIRINWFLNVRKDISDALTSVFLVHKGKYTITPQKFACMAAKFLIMKYFSEECNYWTKLNVSYARIIVVFFGYLWNQWMNFWYWRVNNCANEALSNLQTHWHTLTLSIASFKIEQISNFLFLWEEVTHVVFKS